MFRINEEVEDNDGNYSNYSDQDSLKIVSKAITDERNILASSSPSIFEQETDYIHIANACFYVHIANAVLPLSIDVSTVEGLYWRGCLSIIEPSEMK